jgi:hypothetical protein
MMTKPDRSRRSTRRLATIVHELAGVVLPLAAVEAKREREGVGKVLGAGGREADGGVGHRATIAER